MTWFCAKRKSHKFENNFSNFLNFYFSEQGLMKILVNVPGAAIRECKHLTTTWLSRDSNMLLKPAPPKTKLHSMASAELASSPVQSTSFLNDQQKETLDDVLRPHLRLEPNLDEHGHTARRIEGLGVSFTKPNSKTSLEAGTENVC